MSASLGRGGETGSKKTLSPTDCANRAWGLGGGGTCILTFQANAQTFPCSLLLAL